MKSLYKLVLLWTLSYVNGVWSIYSATSVGGIDILRYSEASFKEMIDCPSDDNECQVICDGFFACFLADIRCPRRADCNVICGGGQANDSCTYTTVHAYSSNENNSLNIQCQDQTSCIHMNIRAKNYAYVLVNASARGSLKGHDIIFEDVKKIDMLCMEKKSCAAHIIYISHQKHINTKEFNLLCAEDESCLKMEMDFQDSHDIEFQMICNGDMLLTDIDRAICKARIFWPALSSGTGKALIQCNSATVRSCHLELNIPDGYPSDAIDRDIELECNLYNSEACRQSVVRCGTDFEQICRFVHHDDVWSCNGACADYEWIAEPSSDPTTYAPTTGPTEEPTADPVHVIATYTPTHTPTHMPTRMLVKPTSSPTRSPSLEPTYQPTANPVSVTSGEPGSLGAGREEPGSASTTTPPLATNSPTTPSPITPTPTNDEAALGDGDSDGSDAAAANADSSNNKSSTSVMWVLLLVALLVLITLLIVLVVCAVSYVSKHYKRQSSPEEEWRPPPPEGTPPLLVNSPGRIDLNAIRDAQIVEFDDASEPLMPEEATNPLYGSIQ